MGKLLKVKLIAVGLAVSAMSASAAVDYSSIQTAAEEEIAAVQPVAIAIVTAVVILGFAMRLIKRFGKG